jgi:hypothetical protein
MFTKWFNIFGSGSTGQRTSISSIFFKISIETELRLFNYGYFFKFAVLAKSMATLQIPEASDLDLTVDVLFGSDPRCSASAQASSSHGLLLGFGTQIQF